MAKSWRWTLRADPHSRASSIGARIRLIQSTSTRSIYCHVDGHGVTSEPLTKRRARLTETIYGGPTVRISLVLPGTAADIVDTVRAAGLEGAIAKRRGSTYQPGERSSDWVKLTRDAISMKNRT